MENNQGTPKTLLEAIERPLSTVLVVKPDIPAAFVMSSLIDYLSQHFTTAMLEHSGSADALMDLWKRITGEKSK